MTPRWTRWLIVSALAALTVTAAAAAMLRAQEVDELADLQQVTSAAVAKVAPSVVRVMVPAMTEQQLKDARRRERERRASEMSQESAPPEKPEKEVERSAPETAPPAPETEPLAPKADAPETPPPVPEADAPLPEAEREPAPGDQPDESPPDPAPEDLVAGDTDAADAPVRTGLIVSPDGYVVTSLLSAGLQTEGITVELADGRVLPARRLGEDVRRDVVLLKIDADGLPVAEVAPKSELAVGQWVLALGRTLPVAQPTVNKGILSATERLAGVAIQTDANISPMNYGGPLVDLRGRVVALIAAVGRAGSTSRADMFSDSGIGFAIPLEDILKELPDLKDGRRLEVPFLGIGFSMMRLGKGAEVTHVFAATAAAQSGIKEGDVIIEIEGIEVANSFVLMHEIGARKVGDALTLKIRRGDEVVTVTSTLRARPEHLTRR